MTTAVAPQSDTVLSVLSDDRMKEQFAIALPKHIPVERFMRVALTQLRKVPKLANCTKESFLSCMMDCAGWGIEPDGRNAHLIPYGKECTLILDYKGMIKLARRSGELSDWYAEIVCENDEFEFNMGQITIHRINFKEERGEMYAVYSHAKFKDGTDSYCVMQRAEVDDIRSKSKAGSSGPWKTYYNEMAKKSVIRRHSKTLPLASEVQEAFMSDYDTPLDITADSLIAPAMPETVGEPTLKTEPVAQPAPAGAPVVAPVAAPVAAPVTAPAAAAPAEDQHAVVLEQLRALSQKVNAEQWAKARKMATIEEGAALEMEAVEKLAEFAKLLSMLDNS